MPRHYEILDVFGDRPLAGNPLAVVFDAEGLDDAAMQAVAREFNLSETVFVLPPRNPAHSASVRIFTPAQELPFAGHPTVGTAVSLARQRVGAAGGQETVVTLEEKVGLVRCTVRLDGAAGFAEFDCPKLPERAGKAGSVAAIAAALGLVPSDIGFEAHVPSVWSAGVPYHFVPVASRAALAKAAASPAAWRDAFGPRGAAFLYARAAEGRDGRFRARMFAPEHGIQEDPATGSAVAAFAGPQQEFDALPDGAHAAVFEQGVEMGRPSIIRLEVAVDRSRVTAVRIGGDAVRVMAGELHV